ncbi:N-lysine methyltransferase setd6 [Cucumis sativus]|nr:N-lysine methyltransferase setd6 [Cucumis sativus]
MTSRRLRVFKRWMTSQGIQCSDALQFTDTPDNGISVKALYDLREGDVVANVPKLACLTVKTTSASSIIEEVGLGGYLGLSVALMYERSLGENSNWAGYLQLLPDKECVPLLWSLQDVDQFLCGTELHKTVKEDKTLMYEDWKENILPLMMSAPLMFSPEFFGIEQYFSARSLISSRSFDIDDFHGFGMVPLADLFNHKTNAEDVHFTLVSSDVESDDSTSQLNDVHPYDDESKCWNSPLDKVGSDSLENEANNADDTDSNSSDLRDDPTTLEMIMVKNVKAGNEVFNTYGSLGNAALLHRYGFTEANNPYDIVNIDLELVIDWCSSLFSRRYSRARVSLWRKLEYYGCDNENIEYFEISYDGEPQTELLILIYIMLLSEDAFNHFDLTISVSGNFSGVMLYQKGKSMWIEDSKIRKDVLLTKDVRKALVSLADMREALHGSSHLEEDLETLCGIQDNRKLYHSLMLRVSERTILKKLRSYAAVAGQLSTSERRSSLRKNT